MKRRLKLLGLAAVEAALDLARAKVHVAIARELVADIRESVDDAERKLWDMKTAGMRPEEWN